MTIYVLCVRDPDASNDYTVEPGDADVEIIDLDLGRSDLTEWVEFKPWAQSVLARARSLPKSEIRTAIETIVWTEFESNSDNWDDTIPCGKSRRRVVDVGDLFTLVGG